MTSFSLRNRPLPNQAKENKKKLVRLCIEKVIGRVKKKFFY